MAYLGYLPISANIKKCRSPAAFPYICGRKMSHSFAGRNEALSMHGTDAPPSNRPINNRPPLLASSSPCSLRQSRPSFFLSSPSLAYFFFPSCIQGSRTSFAREEKYTREMRQSSVSLREFFTANKIRVGSLKSDFCIFIAHCLNFFLNAQAISRILTSRELI